MSAVATHPYLAPLAEWAAALSFDDLPDEVVARAKHVVLNNLGCLLLAAGTRAADKHREIPALFGGAVDEAWSPAVPGNRAAATTAAMVNASLINGTELSEGVSKAVVHPGTVLVPAVLAEADRIGASGQDALVAIVAGYELLIRVGWSTAHDPEQPVDTVQAQTLFRGWYPPSLLGGFGAAAAICRLHGANAETVLQALGIVAQLCPTTTLAAFRKGVDAKSLGCGWASAVGIAAARLAIEGFTGGVTAAEDLFPLLVERADFARLEAEVGSKWEIMTLDIKFAAAGPILCEIECAIQIREQFRIDPTQVERIQVETNKRTLLLTDPRPDTASAAKFSGPYCVAQGLLGRTREEMMVEAFEPPAISSTDWHALADCVEMQLNEEYERAFESNPPRLRPTKLTLTMRGGLQIVHEIQGALGIPGFPPEEADFARKYRYLARRLYNKEAIDAQVEAILQLDKLATVRELVDRFGAEPKLQ
jgi:2-methylcitrate dehydratase PrpD